MIHRRPNSIETNLKEGDDIRFKLSTDNGFKTYTSTIESIVSEEDEGDTFTSYQVVSKEDITPIKHHFNEDGELWISKREITEAGESND